MSEASQIEQQQEAPIIREPVTGPLLPRWVALPLYVIFTLLSAVCLVYIIRSMGVQAALRNAVGAINFGQAGSGASASAAEAPLEAVSYTHLTLPTN